MQPAVAPSVDNSVYLELAHDAIEYVRGKVQAGSANRQQDATLRNAQNYQPLDQDYLRKQRNVFRLTANNSLEPTQVGGRMRAPEILDFEDKVCFNARLVESCGFGNCGEQAAVAYRYLRQHNVAGLCLVSLTRGNHEFVVLGAGPAFTTNAEFGIEDAKHALGPGAVICDPWLGGGRSFVASQHWDLAISQMIQEAAEWYMPSFAVRVRCIVRSENKFRGQKVAEWNQKHGHHAIS